MRFFYRLFVLLALCFSAIAVHAQEVIVITDQRYPVVNVPDHARIIELDAAEQYQKEISQNLPNDPEQAAQIVQKRVEEGGQMMQNTMREVLQGAVDAWSMGVTKIPAVIVDQRYVVYGQADVELALQKINTYKEKRP